MGHVKTHVECSQEKLQIVSNTKYSGPLYTRDWEPVTIALQALSLVEKAEPVHIRFTLRSRDQRGMWMQDACKSLHHGIKWITFHGHLDYFQNHLVEVGLT